MISVEDLKIEIVPGLHRGGMHVVGAVGVRVTHIPSGIAAYVDVYRSVARNRAIAIRMIESALTDPDY